MTRTGLIVRVVCGGAIGWGASKLLPLPVILAAVLVMMIWCGISLWQLRKKQKEIDVMIAQLKARICGE